jgi:hypothetical protein
MIRYAKAVAFGVVSAATVAGCGGGGGSGSSGGGAVTKATTKVLLFGAMSTASKVAAVQTSFIVPSGVLVNYSSPAPAGYPVDTYPLRGGAVVPSGPVRVAASDITGTYNTATAMLSLNLLNSARVGLKSGTVGMGIEIATVNFKLVSPGALQVLPVPWQDPAVTVWQEVPTPPIVSVVTLPGFTLNMSTSYQ